MGDLLASQYRVLSNSEIAGFLQPVIGIADLLGGTPHDWQVNDVADGNLNAVYLVEGPRGGVCVKQSLPWVRVAKDTWPLPIERAYFESEYMQRIEPFVEGRAPKFLHFDPVLHVIVMERLQPHIILRQGLIEGRYFPKVAESVADYVAAATFFTSDIANTFERKFTDIAVFSGNHGLQRITLDLIFTDPYVEVWRNRFVRPHLVAWAQALRDDVALKAAVARHRVNYLTRPQALLHGDLHSGSVMVTEEDTRVIDGEFAYVGPIGFDIGAFIGNLLLAWYAKAEHAETSEQRARYRLWILQQIRLFWERFRSRFQAHWAAYSGPSDAYPGSHFVSAAGRASLNEQQAAFLDSVFADTVAYAALKMIRRVIGFAQVADFLAIEDEHRRALAQAGALSLARELLVHPDRYRSLDAVLAAVPVHESAGLIPTDAPAYRQ
jgi:5-methylthioribose kinase